MEITATYSPEDNKLRLYPSERLDQETFERVKAAGFKWAPRQELFVAPKWSCAREDLAISLAGEIEPEEMTLAERAQDKAARLEGIAVKRADQARAFSNAARDISERFAFGQPILVGHHSERKARKDKERMENAASKASKAHSAVGYWLYRATGVERHANHKNAPAVRARRVKTLLAELRDLQRTLNRAHKSLAMWNSAKTDKQIMLILGHGNVPYDLWSAVDKGEVTPGEAKERCIKSAKAMIASDNLSRWISHTLNRLSYERDLLGYVPRYEGEITPTTLQMFVREHGADKPKGTKIDDDLFAIECDAPLPAHIADGSSVELSGDEWRDLMQSCGYVVPAKKAAKPPILNFRAEKVVIASRASYRGAPKTETLEQVEMTKADYKSLMGGAWVAPSACGEFRARTCSDPRDNRAYFLRSRVAVFLTDSKAHPAPVSVKDLEQAQ